MSNDHRPSPVEAREALDSVEAMRRAGVRRSQPPSWFLVLGAFYVWAMFAAQALERPGIATAPLLLALVVTMVALRRNMLAWRRKFSEPASALFAIASVIVAIGLFVAAKNLQERHGVVWAPPAIGALAALAMLAMAAAQRGKGA